jgi:hypothetical protein
MTVKEFGRALLILAAQTDGTMKKIAEKVSEEMAEETKRRTPVDTSAWREEGPRAGKPHLRDTIRPKHVQRRSSGGRFGTGWEGGCYSDDDIASLVENDTRPHAIVASPGKMLRFPDKDGTIIFRKSVYHPGTEGHHMFRIAAVVVEKRMKEITDPEMVRFFRPLR